MNKHDALLTLRESYASSDDGYEFLPEKVNQFGDFFWYVEIKSDAASNRLLDWHAWLDVINLPYTFLVPCQEYALSLSGGYTNPETGRIVVSSDAVIAKFRTITKLFSLLYAKRHDYVDWSNFTFEELQSILISDLDEYRRASQAKGKLKYNSGRPRIEEFLKALRHYSKGGRLISPFAEHELSYIRSTADFVADYLDSIGLNYSQFSTTGHHEFIPIHIALPWLNFIIQRYESDDLKFLRLYWRIRREMIRSGIKTYNYRYVVMRVTAVKDYVDGTYQYRTGARLDAVKKLKSFITPTSEEIFGTVVDMEQLLTWLAKQKDSNKRKDFMVVNVAEYLSHLYAAIAMTNGPRRSEIATLRLSDFQEVSEEISNYKSFIHKTNEGLPTIRQISGFVHDIAKKTCDLGFIDRQNDGINLFYISPSDATNERPDISTKTSLFNRSYQSFLDSLPSEMAREIRREMPEVTPHQARHLFAAFALRVSDGNVFEKIRHHFRHEYRSFMTNEYTEYKLSDMEQKHVEREYIREIIGCIANEKDHGYFGPMLSTLEKLIEEHLDFLPVDSINDLNEKLDKLTDLIDTVKVHEWGLCLPLVATKVKSKCYDKQTKIPQYDTGSSFNTCSGCIHLLSQEACLEDIQRIAIGISQTLENHPVISGSTRNVLELAYKRALSLMDQCNLE